MFVPLEMEIRETLTRRKMLDEAPGVVLGVSGGPDSMAMLHALVRLRADAPMRDNRLIVAHFDHGLRGAESTEDAAFVRAAADRLDLECVVGREAVADRANDTRRNLEAVARELRYVFLTRIADERRVARVATGHTASDQAETVLMRLSRGTGVDGIAGIAYERPLAPGVILIRPLLDVSREEVLAYCADREIPFRVDTTNADVALRRAFVRHEILPRLEQAAPGSISNLARAATLADDDRTYFAEIVERAMHSWGIEDSGPVALPVVEVSVLPPAVRRRVLRDAVRRARGDLKRLTSAHIAILERLLDRPHGAADLPYGVRARREGDALVVDCVDRKSG
jgi:tRNA(Ile)-lysidine synthase